MARVGMQDLGTLYRDGESVAPGISANGAIVVGYRAVRWGSIRDVLDLGAGPDSVAGFMTADGSEVMLDTNIVVSAALKPDGLQRTVVVLALTKPARWYVTESILDDTKKCSPARS